MVGSTGTAPSAPPRAILLAVMAVLAAAPGAAAGPPCGCGGAPVDDPTLVPMPMDIAPHPSHFIAGERHYDIGGRPESTHHYGDHFISFGHHNYDMSGDPSRRGIAVTTPRRHRGMEPERGERLTVLARRMPEVPGPDPGSVRPSWWAIYKRHPGVHR
jgi:hypothetical protein